MTSGEITNIDRGTELRLRRPGEITDQIMQIIGRSFLPNDEGLYRTKRIPEDIEELLRRHMDEIDRAYRASFVGPTPIIKYPKPPKPPPAEQLLEKFLDHVGRLEGKDYFVAHKASGVEFTEAEKHELVRLEVRAVQKRGR